MKATKAQVTIGHLVIDGYLCDNGIFGMSMAGLGVLCGLEAKHSSTKIMANKYVKSLAAKGFETTKNVKCDNFAINFVALDWVPAILHCLAMSGNELASEFAMTLAGLSLQKLFSDAFGQKFETEEMQAWLRIRTQGIERRNEWTLGIKNYCETTEELSDSYKQWVYTNVSDRLNKALTGHKSKHWCDLLECTSATLRDKWKDSHLSNVEAIERHALVLLNKGAEPKEALEQAIEFFGFPENPEPQKTISKDAQRMRDKRAKEKSDR